MCHACEEAGRVCNIGQPCTACLNSSKLCHYSDPDKLRLVWRQSVERYGREQALERLANMVKEDGSKASSANANQAPPALQIHAGLLKSHRIDALGHFNGETSGLMASVSTFNVDVSESTLPHVPITPPPVSTYNQTHLLDSYFTHVHPRYPFLSERDFSAKLQAQSKGQQPTVSILFLYAIFAAGAKMMPTNIDFSTRMFFDYCMQIKHLFMDRPRVSTICALALLSACCPESTSNGQSSKLLSAMLASEANTMARIMGLHRKLEYESPIVQRDRCRVFWILFVADRLYSMNNGYPLSWDEKQIEVDTPMVEDYADDPDMSNIMQDFHFYIKLCKIVGRICNHGYAPKSEEMRTSWKQDTMLSTLDSWLTSYILELPQHLRYDPSTIVATPRMELDLTLALQHPPKSLFARIIHLIIHTCLILLHSPYISDSDKADSSKQAVASQPSLDLCIYAATLITHITSVMLQEYPIMASQCPYTIHSLLIAIRIHLMCAISQDANFAVSGRTNFFQSANTLHRMADEAGKMWIIENLRSLHCIYTSQQHADQGATQKQKMQPIDSKRKVKVDTSAQQRLRRKKSIKLGYGGTSELAPNSLPQRSPIKQQRDVTMSPSIIANMQVAAVVRSPSSASSTSSSPSNNAGTRDSSQTITTTSSIKTTSSTSGVEMYPTPFPFEIAADESHAVGDLMSLTHLEPFAPFGSDTSILYDNPMFAYANNNYANAPFMNPRWPPPNPAFDPNHGF